ncbi:unnamed protein product [Schistosoma margrebowiei]|uniref:Uncharacterized protein n=1 Tax=Schistosoma margrebowiei TaxID=48269 RepID=A0A3P7XLX7_9TREM|nr:unnamed protein product [Schistosoma margrebowiei]
MGLVNWMYLHHRVDVHSETRTQYHSLQNAIALSTSLLSPDSHLLVQWDEFKFTWYCLAFKKNLMGKYKPNNTK